jgi:hypothetical protein
VKTFCSAQDIEDLAAQGKTELIVDDELVLTDLARHTAQQLGVAVVYRSQETPKAAPPQPQVPVSVQSTSSVPAPLSGAGSNAIVDLGSKPSGCQHPPLTSHQPAPAVTANGSNTVVDQLVGMVKRLGARGSGG